MSVINSRLRFASKSYSEWEIKNPILLKGELSYDSTNKRFKIGNGESNWLDLEYCDENLIDRLNELNIKLEIGTDWNQNNETAVDYVKNRTHYESVETVNEPLNITWDGNTEGLAAMPGSNNLVVYRISDVKPTLEQMQSGTYSISAAGVVEGTGTLSNATVLANTEQMLLLQVDNSFLFLVLYSEYNGLPSGLYVPVLDGQLYVSSLTTTESVEQTKTVVHKLDEKWLPDNLATNDYVDDLYKRLSSDKALRFYCVEDVAVVVNGVSTVYPANSNVEVKFAEGDEFEIIPTSDNSILVLNGFPGALGTYYSWLEGVKQFSNILFDMNAEDMYTKWNQGNQGAYQVQYAQYSNCIFWSDNPYINDVAVRTNYTLYNTAQLPLCYSSIPDNTFKAFYLALGVINDPNWSNPAYKESFAKATWATQVFSYYGARVIGTPEHFSITLPKDCRGLMFYARNTEAAGTFDATNVTNFGAKSGSWREAFGYCSSLRRLYIENLKVSLNISWSPVDYESISYIISNAANTNAIKISVSPYTYNLLSQSDFELATSKNITIELIISNYVEDRRLSAIDDKANIEHTHETADITDLSSQLNTKVPATRKINNKTLDADITLSAADVGADASGSAVNALNESKVYTDIEVAKKATPAQIDSKIVEHNVDTAAHNDIRISLSELVTKVNNFLDVDDATTDQLSELLTLISENADDIEAITNGKVNVSDIIDNLTTNVSNKPLSAAQGVAIKTLIDIITDAKADWNQNDETTIDYVKNRTHWIEQETGICLIPAQSFGYPTGESSSTGYRYLTVDSTVELSLDKTYRVIYNGITYEGCKCLADFSPAGSIAIVVPVGGGDIPSRSVCIAQYSDTEYRIDVGFGVISQTDANGARTIAVYEVLETVHKLNEIFIPDSIARIEDVVDTYATKTELSSSTADWNQNNETAINYIKNRPCYKTVENTNTVLVSIENFEYTEEWDVTADNEIVWDNFSYLSTPVYLVEGDTYIVNFNGTQYECVCTKSGYLGEDSIYNLEEPIQYPFYIYCSTIYENDEEEGYSNGYCVGVYSLIEAPTIFSITEKYVNHYKPLDKNFMPYYNLVSHSEIFNDNNNNEATGSYSHSEGSYTKATGNYSHAEGRNTKATGSYSHSEGSNTQTNGSASHAEGSNTQTNGSASHAEGSSTQTNGSASHAEGSSTHANGSASHAEGSSTYADGSQSHAEGTFSRATGNYSHAEGYDTRANNMASHAGGKYNKEMTAGATGSSNVGDVFVLGNGTKSTSRSNAFRVTYAGASYGLSAFNSTGADYAEFFEWADRNINSEDRVGYFVTLDGDKIIKANASDDYILGIVSGQPCIVGNADEDWLGRWEHDEFGRFIKVETEDPVIEYRLVEKQVPKTDEDGNIVLDKRGKPVMITVIVEEEVETGEVIKGWAYKENPNYDKTQKYIERKDRVEWDYVGMLGVLAVRDNGECVVNGFCKCGEGGIAVPSSKGYDSYRVIERVSDNVIKIVFR